MRLACGLALGLATQGCAYEPLRFENMRVEDVAAYRAVVRFGTSRSASCHVEFGLAPDALDSSATDPEMKPGTFRTTHQVPLEDLAPASVYYFSAVVVDTDAHTTHSEIGQFSTGPGVPVDSLTDVALMQMGATVSAVSSNYANAANDATWGADNAIDGHMTTEWSSYGDGDQAFMELDLGQARAVQFVGFRSRKMSDGTSIVTKFELAIDGGTILGPFVTPDPDVRYVIDLGAPISTRLVRMNAVETSGGNTGLKELQLFSP